MMVKSLSMPLRLLSLVATMTVGSMAFAVAPVPPVSLSTNLGPYAYGYTLEVTDAPAATGTAWAVNGKMYVLEDKPYTFKLTGTEHANWYIGMKPTLDDGINLNHDGRNGSRSGAGPNSTFIDIDKTFITNGTHLIGQVRYYEGPSFSSASMTPVPIEVYTPKVELVGASASETWPCTCPASDVIIAANVLPPPPITNLIWGASCSVSGTVTIISLPSMDSAPPGTPADLADADFFTVFSPTDVPTADYGVTAVLNMSLSCSDRTNLLVRSVPTSKLYSTSEWMSWFPDLPYGRVYWHTFASSAGSLVGVTISEKVTFTNDPFNIAPADIPYGDSLWSLNSAGTMNAEDVYQDPYNGGDININRFSPSPPGEGTPVTFVTEQTYGWRCPLCTNYHDFFTHYIYTGLSDATSTVGIPQYFTRISGALEFVEDYLGNPYLNLSNIVVAPTNVISANGSNTFQIAWSGSWVKSTDSRAQDLEWYWDSSDRLGCTFDSITNNPMTVTVGTNTGTLSLWIDLPPITTSDPTYKHHSINVELVAP